MWKAFEKWHCLPSFILFGDASQLQFTGEYFFFFFKCCCAFSYLNLIFSFVMGATPFLTNFCVFIRHLQLTGEQFASMLICFVIEVMATRHRSDFFLPGKYWFEVKIAIFPQGKTTMCCKWFENEGLTRLSLCFKAYFSNLYLILIKLPKVANESACWWLIHWTKSVGCSWFWLV